MDYRVWSYPGPGTDVDIRTDNGKCTDMHIRREACARID